jgi:hypothetical protein
VTKEDEILKKAKTKKKRKKVHDSYFPSDDQESRYEPRSTSSPSPTIDPNPKPNQSPNPISSHIATIEPSSIPSNNLSSDPSSSSSSKPISEPRSTSSPSPTIDPNPKPTTKPIPKSRDNQSTISSSMNLIDQYKQLAKSLEDVPKIEYLQQNVEIEKKMVQIINELIKKHPKLTKKALYNSALRMYLQVVYDIEIPEKTKYL